MSLGSFLAGAGRIGQGIRTEQAAMRQERAQQLALEELNRQDRFRQLQLQAPVAETTAQGFALGAPMAVVEPPITPTQVGVALPIAPAAPAASPAAPAAVPVAPSPTQTGVIESIWGKTPLRKGAPAGVEPGFVGENALTRQLRQAAGVSTPQGAAPYEGPSVRRASQQQKIQGFQEALSAIPASDPYRRIIGLEGGIDAKTGRFKTSPAGAVGPAQLMPKTAPEAMELAGFNRNDTRWKTDPYVNIMAGRAYYNMLVQRFNGDVTKAAAAYNAGAGRVDSAVRKAERSGLSWVDHMPATETREYVRDFLADSGRATRYTEAGAGVQQAGVNTGATPSAPPTRIDPSNFYLANEGMITQDMRVALQNRQELARMAEMYRQAGMGDQFTQTRLKVQDLDNSMLFLQGMQGISELAYANDPRRIAAVWSQYAGVPIELQPQTDGTYNIVVNGKTTQRGLSQSSIVDNARSAFDAEYRKSRAESSNAIALEQFKSQLRIGEEQAKAVLQAAREAQNFVLKGQNDQALELIKQLDPNGRITPLGDGTGRSYLQVQGQTMLLDPGGNPIEGTDLTTAPSAAPIAGLTQRSVGVGVGG